MFMESCLLGSWRFRIGFLKSSWVGDFGMSIRYIGILGDLLEEDEFIKVE